MRSTFNISYSFGAWGIQQRGSHVLLLTRLDTKTASLSALLELKHHSSPLLTHSADLSGGVRCASTPRQP